MNENRELFLDAMRRLEIAERALGDARARLLEYGRQMEGTAQPSQSPAPASAPQHEASVPQAQPGVPAYPHPAPQHPAPQHPAQSLPPVQPPKPRDREKTLIGAVAVGGALITLAGVAFLVGLAIQAASTAFAQRYGNPRQLKVSAAEGVTPEQLVTHLNKTYDVEAESGEKLAEEIEDTIQKAISRELYEADYADVFKGDDAWRSLDVPVTVTSRVVSPRTSR